MKLPTEFFLEDGQGLTEYSLLLGLLVITAAAGLLILGPKVTALYTGAEVKFR